MWFWQVIAPHVSTTKKNPQAKHQFPQCLPLAGKKVSRLAQFLNRTKAEIKRFPTANFSRSQAVSPMLQGFTSK